MTRYEDAKETAGRLLTYYFRQPAIDLHWDSDNTAEIHQIMSEIETMIEEKIKEALKKGP